MAAALSRSLRSRAMSDRWQRIEEIFHTATDLSDGARATYLDAICAGDLELRFEIESLLSHDGSAETLFSDVVAQTAQRLSDKSGEEWIGRTIGPYRITSLIGKGGMGAVYRG